MAPPPNRRTPFPCRSYFPQSPNGLCVRQSLWPAPTRLQTCSRCITTMTSTTWTTPSSSTGPCPPYRRSAHNSSTKGTPPKEIEGSSLAQQRSRIYGLFVRHRMDRQHHFPNSRQPFLSRICIPFISLRHRHCSSFSQLYDFYTSITGCNCRPTKRDHLGEVSLLLPTCLPLDHYPYPQAPGHRTKDRLITSRTIYLLQPLAFSLTVQLSSLLSGLILLYRLLTCIN